MKRALRDDFRNSSIIANLNAIRQMGADAWLTHQWDRFACSCGKRLSWYTKKCIHLGWKHPPAA